MLLAKTYVPVKTLVACTADASDLDRRDTRFWVNGQWSDWFEEAVQDDVASGDTPADYHIWWSASNGRFAPEYGRRVSWGGLPPDGTAVDTVTITVFADDFQRGNEAVDMLGDPGDPMASASATIKVWEVPVSSHTSGQLSQYNDTWTAFFCGSGGDKLGKVNHGEPSSCSGPCGPIVDGFYYNIELQGSVPAEVPGAYLDYKFAQDLRGTTTALRVQDSTWVTITSVPDRTSDGVLYGDNDTRSPNASGADRNVVFGRDSPGNATECGNNKWSGQYSELKRDYHFWTWVTYNDTVVSTEYEWDNHQHLKMVGGVWTRLE